MKDKMEYQMESKSKNENNGDVLQVQGRMARGYGMIPKMIMQDRRLTPEAKCIYAYFCSFAGAGSTAFPGRDKILYDLRMGENRYYRHFNLLKECGYITVSQHVDTAHKFSHNIYTLVETVAQNPQNKPNPPHPQNEGTEKPYPHFPHTEDPHTENPCTENGGVKSNREKSNNDKMNSAENQQSMSTSTSEPPTEPLTETATLTIGTEIPTKKELPSIPPAVQSIGTEISDESSGKNQAHPTTYEALEATVRENIRYEDFVAERHPHIKLIDEIVHNMLDVLTSRAPHTRIKSRDKETAVVKSVFMKLGYAHIAYVVERFRDVTYPIVHKGSYLKTLLYTSLEEMESYYENQYRTGAL